VRNWARVYWGVVVYLVVMIGALMAFAKAFQL
jgi:hypothetical protein